ncbi:hypothetical protein [Caldibacillus sp. 210928-DFI.2.22]|nr:hypothetical protein [Caldibacillus sp. 210928-DFI.2.22]
MTARTGFVAKKVDFPSQNGDENTYRHCKSLHNNIIVNLIYRSKTKFR